MDMVVATGWSAPHPVATYASDQWLRAGFMDLVATGQSAPTTFASNQYRRGYLVVARDGRPFTPK